MTTRLDYTLAHPDTKPPTLGTIDSAGLDLTADETVVIPVGATRIVSTGVAMAIPRGMWGDLRVRSSLAVKHGIGLANQGGVIDADYRGVIKAALTNWGNSPVTIRRGTRIVQIIVQRYEQTLPVPVDTLDDTARGAGGFGSTGA